MYEFVYIIQFSNRIKIGYTKNIRNRFNSLQNGSGEKIYNSFYVYGNEALEKQMHTIFQKDRIMGEYFNTYFDVAINTLKSLVQKKDLKINPIIKKYNDGLLSPQETIEYIQNNTKTKLIDVIQICDTLGYDVKIAKRKPNP